MKKLIIISLSALLLSGCAIVPQNNSSNESVNLNSADNTETSIISSFDNSSTDSQLNSSMNSASSRDPVTSVGSNVNSTHQPNSSLASSQPQNFLDIFPNALTRSLFEGALKKVYPNKTTFTINDYINLKVKTISIITGIGNVQKKNTTIKLIKNIPYNDRSKRQSDNVIAEFLVYSGVDDINAFTGIEKLPGLEEFMYETFEFGKTDMKLLSKLTNIKVLDLKFTESDPIANLNTIKDFKNLEYLSVQGQITEDLSFISSLQKIKFLSLPCTPKLSVAHISQLTNLESLLLSNGDLKQDLSKLKSLSKLKLLSLNYITLDSINALDDIIPQLDTLLINYISVNQSNYMSADFQKHISENNLNPNLKYQ